MESSYNNRQVQIINAAIKLMGEGGIQKLTTKNLALEVGVTEPALYRHFSNKIDILRQVLEYLKSRILYRLDTIISSGKSPGEMLEELVGRQFEAFSRRPEIVVVLLSEGLYQNHPELSQSVFSIMQESAIRYIRVIEEGQELGLFRRDIAARQIAFMLMGSMRFCVIQWHLLGNSYSLVSKGEELLYTFKLMLSTA